MEFYVKCNFSLFKSEENYNTFLNFFLEKSKKNIKCNKTFFYYRFNIYLVFFINVILVVR